MKAPRQTVPAALAALLLAGCGGEAPAVVSTDPVAPPVDSFESIPDAPLSGILRGTAFTVHDARYHIDRRLGYAHTDIVLSLGTAESPCGELKPKGASSVWLRLDGKGAVDRGQLRIDPRTPGPWTVHYQLREENRWLGNGDGAALLNVRSIGMDGKIAGDLAVCFGDGKKSCVKGSFEARSCPTSIDEPVRGALPAEDVEGKLPKPKPVEAADAGAPADAGAASDAGARDGGAPGKR